MNHPKEIKFDTRRIPLKKLKIEAIKKQGNNQKENQFLLSPGALKRT